MRERATRAANSKRLLEQGDERVLSARLRTALELHELNLGRLRADRVGEVRGHNFVHGFTGTPIDAADKNTRSIFGDYVSVYDIQRAVEDGATVPIYYESRLAKLELKEEERPHLDEAFDELTEGEDLEGREKLKTKWSALEALVGTDRRVQLIAKDLVEHFEARLEAMDGKAMLVCMSRRICVDLYKALTALRPDWHDESDDKGALKVVMTGSASDPSDWQQHIRSKQRREALAKRFRTRATRSSSSSSATCGSRVSTPRACIRCTSTSRCRGTA